MVGLEATPVDAGVPHLVAAVRALLKKFGHTQHGDSEVGHLRQRLCPRTRGLLSKTVRRRHEARVLMTINAQGPLKFIGVLVNIFGLFA